VCSLDPIATTHPDPISTYEARAMDIFGYFISHTQNWFQIKGGRIGGLQNFLSKLGKWAVYTILLVTKPGILNGSIGKDLKPLK
jgi:hypothetical protein